MSTRKIAALMLLAAGLIAAGWGLWSRDGLGVVVGGLVICAGFRLIYGFWPWDDEGWDRQ